jgi:hypothetical protein
LVLRVVLDRPVVQPVARVLPRPAVRQTWLADVFAEVVG